MTARIARRSRLRSESGASVATTIMIEPCDWSSRSSTWLRKAYRPSSRPTGAPAICRMPPKLDWTSTPTVYPPSDVGSKRELVPIPPFQPNADVPVPAPTAPSSTGPVVAALSAALTSTGRIGRVRMSFRPPSFVSPTTGFMDRTRSMPSISSAHSTIASAAFHTHSVQVSRMGVSSSPSSRTCVTPSSLPNPLATYMAAGTRSK